MRNIYQLRDFMKMANFTESAGEFHILLDISKRFELDSNFHC